MNNRDLGSDIAVVQRYRRHTLVFRAASHIHDRLYLERAEVKIRSDNMFDRGVVLICQYSSAGRSYRDGMG